MTRLLVFKQMTPIVVRGYCGHGCHVSILAEKVCEPHVIKSIHIWMKHIQTLSKMCVSVYVHVGPYSQATLMSYLIGVKIHHVCNATAFERVSKKKKRVTESKKQGRWCKREEDAE